MHYATALPIKGAACWNRRVLQGTDLAAAIRSALEMKAALPGAGRVGPTALARALEMTQPSASELLKTGRLAKEKLPLLLAFFEDVVGPDHFGLPYSKFEAEFIRLLRRLPQTTQQQLLERVKSTARKIDEATADLSELHAPEPATTPDFLVPVDGGMATVESKAAAVSELIRRSGLIESHVLSQREATEIATFVAEKAAEYSPKAPTRKRSGTHG